MLNRMMFTEWAKIKRSKIWYFVAFMMIFPILYGVIINQVVVIGKYHFMEGNPWYMLIMMVQLFYGTIFLPVIVSVIAGTLINYERKANNWERLFLAPIKKSYFYYSKLAWMGLMVLLIQLFMVVAMIASGFISGIEADLPVSTFLSIFVLGTVGAISLGAVLFYLFLRMESHRGALMMSIVLSFPSFLVLSNNGGSWLPVLYPWALPFFGMTQASLNLANFLAFLAVCLLVIVLFSMLSLRRLNKGRV